MKPATIRYVLLAAALAATFAVLTAAVAVRRILEVEREVLGARSACECCEEPGR